MSTLDDIREACRRELFDFSKRLDVGSPETISGVEIPEHLTPNDLSDAAADALAGGDLFAAFVFTIASNRRYALEHPDA